MIGGTWGGEDMFEKVRVVDFLQGPDRLIFFKNLWRMGFSRCPTSCTPGDRCACAVPDVYIDTYGPQYILEYAGIYDMIKDKLHDNSDETLIKVIRALEDPGVAGDMFSSASSFDPSFWVVHGTLERILSLKRARLQINPERTFDETWGFSTANTRYLVGICDWSAITDTQNDLTLPACNMDPGKYFEL
jgi:hypothetical protein